LEKGAPRNLRDQPLADTQLYPGLQLKGDAKRGAYSSFCQALQKW